MYLPLILATALLAASEPASPPPAKHSHPACAVSHHQCYPACIKMNADGSDCAKTRTVCRDVCGEKPEPPSQNVQPPSQPQPE